MAENEPRISTGGRTAGAISILVVLLLAAAGLVRVRYGFDISEEGTYLSAAYRYMFGDLPYRDELLSAGHSYDVLLSLVMKNLPDAGTILTFRYLALFLNLSCIGILFLALRKKVPAIILTAGFFCAVYANVFGLWTPGYHTLTRDFVSLTLGLWLMGRDAETRASAAIWGLLSGISLFVTIFCYMPMLILMVFPAVSASAALVEKKHKDPSFIFPTVFCATTGFLCLSGVLLVYRIGLWPDFIVAKNALQAIPQYSMSVLTKIARYLYNTSFAVPGAAIQFCIWLTSFKLIDNIASGNRKSDLKLLICLLLLFTAIALFPLSKMLQGWPISGAALGILFLGGYSRNGAPFSRTTTAILAFGILWHLIIGMVSASGGGYTITYCTPAFFLLSCIAAHGIAEARSGAGASPFFISRSRAVVAATLFAFGIIIISKSFWHSYQEDPLPGLDTPFTFGRLKGLHSSATRVRDLEALLEYLEPRLEKNERLLAFDEACMINYLTSTMPASDTTFVDKAWTVGVRKKLVENMLKKGRVPRYAVRMTIHPRDLGHPDTGNRLFYSEDPEKDPMFAFIAGNYLLTEKFGPYEVWLKKIDGKH